MGEVQIDRRVCPEMKIKMFVRQERAFETAKQSCKSIKENNKEKIKDGRGNSQKRLALGYKTNYSSRILLD